MEFKVGDKVKVNCPLYLSFVKNDTGVIIKYCGDDVFVLNDEIKCKYGTDGFSVSKKNITLIEQPRIEGITGGIKSEENKIETGINPARYNRAKLELWDAFHLLDLDAFQSNVLKYTYRYEDKDGEQDLVKAINYTLKMLSIRSGVGYKDLFKMSVEELNNKFKK